MKIILSSRGHHYVARVSIFLVTVALIAGMVGCGSPTPTPPVEPLYITQVTAGWAHTVGLKDDGTVEWNTSLQLLMSDPDWVDLMYDSSEKTSGFQISARVEKG